MNSPITAASVAAQVDALSRGTQESAQPLGDRSRFAQSRVLWWVVLLAVVVAAVGLRLSRLGDDCFDEDELYAVYVQGTSPRAVAAVVGRDGLHTNHPPLMTVPYLFWTALVGTGEFEVRLFPVLMSLLSIGLTFALTNRIAGRTAALVATGFLTLNPLHISYAQEARQYSCLVALVAGCHLTFLASLEQGRLRHQAAYFVLAVLAVMTHYFGAIALTGHAVVCGWGILCGGANTRRAAARTLFTLTLAAVICSPWMVVVRHQAHQPWRHLEPVSLESITNTVLTSSGAFTPRDGGIVVGSMLAGLLLWGLRSSRGSMLPISGTQAMNPLPVSMRVLVPVVAIVAAIAAWVFVPSVVLPLANKLLGHHGYEQSRLEAEVNVIRQLGVMAPVGLLISSLAITAWPVLDRRLFGAVAMSPSPLPAWVFVGSLIFAPFVALAATGLLNIPIVQTRNMIVLLPGIALGIGVGVAALIRTPAGRLLTVVLVGIYIAAISHYRPIMRPFGGDGIDTGSATLDWRAPATWLARSEVPPLPLVTVQEPLSDPVKWYMKQHNPIRLAPETPTSVAIPDDFYYLHISDDEHSNGLRQRLAKTGVGLTVMWQEGRFTIYRATLSR